MQYNDVIKSLLQPNESPGLYFSKHLTVIRTTLIFLDMNNNNQAALRIIEYSSFATALLIFIGLTRNLVFWREFNIDVFNYISFSEIIIYSFDVVHNNSYVLMPIFILLFFFRKNLEKLALIKWWIVLLVFLLLAFIFLCIYRPGKIHCPPGVFSPSPVRGRDPGSFPDKGSLTCTNRLYLFTPFS